MGKDTRFEYNDGRFWKLDGNAGTTASTNFLGTTDNVDLYLKRNNTNAIRLGSGFIQSFQNHRFANGTSASPSITFGSTSNMGMFRAGENILGFSTSGQERLRFSATESVFNNANQNYNFRIRTNGNSGATGTHTFFVRSSDSRIGIRTSAPDSPLHIVNGATNIPDGSGLAHMNLSSVNGFAVLGIANSTNYYSRGAIMGVNRSKNTAYITAAIYGMADGEGYFIENNGVQAATNGLDAHGILASRYDPLGLGFGFGGLIMNDLGYTGSFVLVSDRRLKKDINSIDNGLEIIKKLNPVSYLYDTTSYPNMGLNVDLEYGFH